MNTRLKYIGALVIVALLGVAAYQAYWLEQLHFTIGEQPWIVGAYHVSMHGISQARILEWVAISFSG